MKRARRLDRGQNVDHLPCRYAEGVQAFDKFREQVNRRGMVAVISDFYCDIDHLLEGVRPLAWHGQEHGLTKRDMQLMQRAEELVAGEMALIRETELKTAQDELQAILSEAIRERETDQ